MKTYTTLLFDWDGCLVQSLPIWLAAYQEVFAEYGLHPSDEEITTKVFGNWQGPAELGIKNLDEYIHKLLTLVNERAKNAPLHPGAKEILAYYHQQGKKLALITTSKRDTVIPALRYHHLTELFDVILTDEDVTHSKPNPEIIAKAIRATQGSFDQTLIIGDSKSDLGAATNAGIDSVLFYPEAHHQFYNLEVLKTYHPTHIIHNFSELKDIIR